MISIELKNPAGQVVQAQTYADTSVAGSAIAEFCASLLRSARGERRTDQLLALAQQAIGLDVCCILLYGSYARGSAEASSDLDFLILTNRDLGIVQQQVASGSLFGIYHGICFDGHILEVGQFLTEPLEDWQHLRGFRILGLAKDFTPDAVRQGFEQRLQQLAELELIQAQSQTEAAVLTSQTVFWLEKMLVRIEAVRAQQPAKALILLAQFLSEFRQIYAELHNWPPDSVSGWYRSVKTCDSKLIELLDELAESHGQQQILVLKQLINHLSTTAIQSGSNTKPDANYKD